MEERERRQLDTDLHDHVGQILALAQIKLGAMLESASSTHLAEPLVEVRRFIKQTIQYTDLELSTKPSPSSMISALKPAVEWLAELMQEQHGLSIKVENGSVCQAHG